MRIALAFATTLALSGAAFAADNGGKMTGTPNSTSLGNQEQGTPSRTTDQMKNDPSAPGSTTGTTRSGTSTDTNSNASGSNTSKH